MTTARWTTVSASAAALCLLLFPVLRPWPDETVPSAALAHAFASERWVIAHLCGILGLGLLAPTLLGARRLWGDGASARRVLTAAVATAWAGAGLCALYFGAEIFGIRTITQAALHRGDLSTFLDDVTALREQPAAMTAFGAGLLAIAAAGVLVAVRLWRDGGLHRGAGTLVAAGLVLYLPQFFGPPAVRVGHGVLTALGLALLAVAAGRRSRERVAA